MTPKGDSKSRLIQSVAMFCFGGSGNIMDDLPEINEQINKHKDVKQICSI